jgi:L-alanine-DL-glutamate epimerase and related enzymes of enolase superfamily
VNHRRLVVRHERWPLARPFTIARGTKVAADVVVAEVEVDGCVGRGEAVPYARYGETVDDVVASLRSLSRPIAAGLDRLSLQARLPAGAARNALDCALWDLECKRAGERAWQQAGLPAPPPTITAETIGLDTVDGMAEQAVALRDRPLLKVKLGADDVIARVAAVRRAAPASRLIVDANEGWSPALLHEILPALAAMGVELIEQPLRAGEDEGLTDPALPVTLCADESCHTTRDLYRLPVGYRMINVKLDKAGGLTEAIRLIGEARRRGLKIMVGCMVATSLGIAPAMLIASLAEVVDLDGPVWLARDREPGLVFAAGTIQPYGADVWG